VSDDTEKGAENGAVNIEAKSDGAVDHMVPKKVTFAGPMLKIEQTDSDSVRFASFSHRSSFILCQATIATCFL